MVPNGIQYTLEALIDTFHRTRMVCTEIEMPLISIEGNIGSGKSTLVKELEKHWNGDVVILQEPVNAWMKIRDPANEKTMLELFYENPKENAFAFQMMAYVSRYALIRDTLEKHPDTLVITERCMATDREVFVNMLKEDGILREVDYQIYMEWVYTLGTKYHPDHIVYIRTRPETCLERIQKRDRRGEKDIPVEYLQKCHQAHERWIGREITENGLKRMTILEGDIHREDFSDWVAFIQKLVKDV
jgi:deoxyguanosine kinase